MARMRHPDVDAVITVPDDPGTIAVHEEAGWEVVPDPVQTNPALAPVDPDPDPAPKRRAKPDPAPAGKDHTDPKEP